MRRMWAASACLTAAPPAVEVRAQARRGLPPETTATLADFYAVFGDVMDTDMVIACLRTNAARVAVVAG